MATQPDRNPERPRFGNEPAVVERFTAAAPSGSQSIERFMNP